MARSIPSPLVRWWAPIAVGLPIAWNAGRAAAGDWVPIGDDAYFTARSRDVFTRSHPLLGAWSSGSAGLADPVNNLGPLQLDLLAPFTRWTPAGGTAIGVAFVNLAALAAIAWLVARVAGRAAVAPAMVAVGLLSWTMGSEMLITPRQHQAMILPYLCFLVAAWAVASGDRWALVPAVVAGSLVAQTHLSYPVLVVAVLTVAIVTGHVLGGRADTVRGGARALGVAALTFAVLWAQTLIDQFAGRGNLGHVVFGSGDSDRAGWSAGARIVAGTLVSFDPFARPGYHRFEGRPRMADLWQSVVMWMAVAAAIAWTVRAVRRAEWTARTSAVVVAVVAVVAGVVDAALLPPTEFGLVTGNYRWLWATAAFVAIGVVIGVFERARAHDALSRGAAIVVAAACGALAIANVPGSVQVDGPTGYAEAQAITEELMSRLNAALDDTALPPIVLDDSGVAFSESYTYAVVTVLQAHDVDFRFDDERQLYRFGGRRRAEGGEPRLSILSGPAASAAAGDPGLVVFVESRRPVALVLVDV